LFLKITIFISEKCAHLWSNRTSNEITQKRNACTPNGIPTTGRNPFDSKKTGRTEHFQNQCTRLGKIEIVKKYCSAGSAQM